MTVGSEDDVDNFEDAVIEVMYRVEGISHFAIENFYTFDYLSSYDTSEQPTLNELTSKWYSTFTNYNSILLEQLKVSQTKVQSAKSQNSDVSFNSYIRERVSIRSICAAVILRPRRFSCFKAILDSLIYPIFNLVNLLQYTFLTSRLNDLDDNLADLYA